MSDILTLLHQMTAFAAGLQNPIWVTDGTDIFMQEGSINKGSIYKYDVANNTDAKLVDESAFKLNATGSFSMILFKGNIYVGTTDGTIVAPLAFSYVYKVTPAGVVTEVLSDFPRSAAIDTGGGGANPTEFKLYATDDYLVAVYHEQANGPETSEFLSRHTTNGTTWFASTTTFSETVRISGVALTDAQDGGRDYRTLGIYDRFPVGGTTVIILKFVDGVWSKVLGPKTNTDDDGKLFQVAADHFWNRLDFGQYTDDWSTYHIPSSTGKDDTVSLNMEWASVNTFALDTWDRLNTASPPTGTKTDAVMDEETSALGDYRRLMVRLNSGVGLMFTKATGDTSPDWSVWQRDANLGPTPGAWGGGGAFNRPALPLPCSIDAAGAFVYIAALNSVNLPVLLKLDTGLATNPTIVFEPGQGGDIGVVCGKEDADTVWIGGDFGDTDVLEKSEDAGDTFTVKDDGTFGDVTAFHIGPDSDNRVLLADDNVNIEETVDGGTTWTTVNTGVGFTINAIARLATDVKEAVFGNVSNVTNNIDYSLDSGENMEDFTTGVFPTDDVKSVIVN